MQRIPVTGIVFDLDGTLLNSLPHYHTILNTILETHGGKLFTFDEYLESIYGRWLDIVARRGVDIARLDETEHIINPFFEGVSAVAPEMKLFPDVECMLGLLKSRYALPLGIVSARNKNVLTDCERLGLTQYVHNTMIHEAQYKKADAIRHFYTEHNLDPKTVLMVGDMPSDMDCAGEAGVVRVGITRGLIKVEMLLYGKTDYCISRLDELLDIIE